MVVPVTILVEGVHFAGNADVPYLYPEEALSMFPEIWNDTAALINHPKTLTANVIETHESEVIGRLWNTKYDKGLKPEIWIDEERLKEKNPDLHSRIDKGDEIEVSTGVWLELEEKKGTWNGEEYGAEVVRLWPDHLAILPEDTGACSIKDGCGIRNKGAEEPGKVDDGLVKRIMEGIKGLISNKEDCKCQNHDPEEPGTEVNQMDRKKVIAALIANKHYTEDDRKSLEALDEKHLAKLATLCGDGEGAQAAAADPAQDPKTDPEKTETVETETPAAEAKKGEGEQQAQTEEEYINSAPEGLREVFQEGLNMRKKKKADLVAAIKGNPENRFSDEALNAMSIDGLENIAALAHVEVDYSLNGSGSSPTGNEEVPGPTPVFLAQKAANE